MLRALKRKFLAVTMSLISLVLLIVFAAMLFSTYSQQMGMINMSLKQNVDSVYGFDMPKEQFGRQTHGERFMTTISVLAGSDGNIIHSNADNVEISDDDLAAAVSAALANESGQGFLSELGLFYMRRAVTDNDIFGKNPFIDEGAANELPTLPSSDVFAKVPETDAMADIRNALREELSSLPEGTSLYRLAFVSSYSLRQSMSNMILSSLMIGAGALIVLFAICLYLSNWALKPVERTWNQQKRFISDASHELKTPLTVILANLDILKKHGGDRIDSQHKWLDNSEDEAMRMKNLVEDLLTLARLDEVGQTANAPELITVCFTDAVWSSLLTFEPVAFEQGLLLDSNIAADVYVRGDEQKLRQLTTILLDNACKYAGKRGSVTISLTATAERARLTVSNTGEVIPPESLSHLFERFYRADTVRGDSKGGYGLGLSIAAGIAKLHKGSISASSDSQNGTVFTVTLPSCEKPASDK